VLALAADGSGWSDLPPLLGARACAAATVLLDGTVLVAGGLSRHERATALSTAELWDPATQKWTALPPMAHERDCPTACMLPSGRVAVVGGGDGSRKDDSARSSTTRRVGGGSRCRSSRPRWLTRCPA
jgi:hypothetical protein